MHLSIILKTLGLVLILFSFSMLPPMAVDLIYHEDSLKPFFAAFSITMTTGLACWVPFRGVSYELKTRDGFVVVVLLWIVVCWFASIPFMLSNSIEKTFLDALFESTSGLTTTGASIMSNLGELPHALLYYRQQLQFLGGMGIIVLAVAILPMLGIGGMQLYRAEIPGPIKDTKLTPRITETAKALWYIYVGLTLSCALGFWAAGMQPFDAICESFSTVATGGFSVHMESFAFYNNAAVELIASLFMLLSGANYSLHFIALRRTSLSHYFEDLEFRSYVLIIFLTIVLTTVVLMKYHVYSDTETAIIKSIFNVVSLATTTGLESAKFEQWPSFIPFLLMFVAIIGGCAASTAGGMKVLRILLLQKQALRELHRLIHPKAILPIKFGRQILSEEVVEAMWAFIATFVFLFVVMMLILLADGNDLTTSFGALVASLANAGNAIGAVSQHFADLSAASKWVLIFAMIAGRLEIFTVLVLLTPAFWRR